MLLSCGTLPSYRATAISALAAPAASVSAAASAPNTTQTGTQPEAGDEASARVPCVARSRTQPATRLRHETNAPLKHPVQALCLTTPAPSTLTPWQPHTGTLTGQTLPRRACHSYAACPRTTKELAHAEPVGLTYALAARIAASARRVDHAFAAELPCPSALHSCASTVEPHAHARSAVVQKPVTYDRLHCQTKGDRWACLPSPLRLSGLLVSGPLFDAPRTPHHEWQAKGHVRRGSIVRCTWTVCPAVQTRADTCSPGAIPARAPWL
ncbi:hypothetical protein PSPO01_06310 [Paraphaeosphaeria sporulosa]